MAIAFVKDFTSITNTFTVPAGGCAAGNLLVYAGGWDDLNTISGITDSRSNSWANAGAASASGAHSAQLWYSLLTTTLQAADSITVSMTGGQIAGAIVGEWSGISSSPLDKSQHTEDTTTSTHTSGSTTTTAQADELLVGVHSYGANTAWTPTGGFTANEDLLAFSSFKVIEQYLIVSSTGTYESTGTTVGNVSARNAIATFKATAAAGPEKQSFYGYRRRTVGR